MVVIESGVWVYQTCTKEFFLVAEQLLTSKWRNKKKHDDNLAASFFWNEQHLVYCNILGSLII